MSLLKSPRPAKLVISVFTNNKRLIQPVSKRFSAKYGPVDLVSPWFPFNLTDYYAPEMGPGLERRMLAFKTLIAQDRLAGIKLETNLIENEFIAGGKRRVNIDPGYLVCERFVLATGKNFAHRIYIGDNIYADLTLIYRAKRFQPLPWTYPDYAEGNIHDFLLRVRRKYLEDIKVMPK